MPAPLPGRMMIWGIAMRGLRKLAPGEYPAALRAAGALEVAAPVPEWVAGYLADSSAA